MSNDLISRKWLTDAIRNRRTYLSYEDAKDVIDLIDNAPTVDERPQGEWLDVVCENGGFFHGTCSVCKIRNDIPPLGMANFCPNCGADMRKGGAE